MCFCHPSGQYTATASSTFTVAGGSGSGQVGNVVNAYDADGNVTSRTWDSGLVQTLTWDAFGRLIKVSQRDTANSGYDWTAVYDGLGRRLKNTQQPVTAGVAAGSPTGIASVFDPQVEFLEIGVAVNGAKAWKVFGPDLNGRFGGLQGTGGLDAVILDADGTTTGVINDQFGNGVATVSGGAVTWNTTRVGAYGPLPGLVPQTLGDVTQLAAATAWRSHRIDPTGFYWLGARYYESTSGRFLSADPAGHAASPSLYDFAGGDPVNFFDPTGRCKDGSLAKMQESIDNFGASTQTDVFGGLRAVNAFNARNSSQDSEEPTWFERFAAGVRDPRTGMTAADQWNGMSGALQRIGTVQSAYDGNLTVGLLNEFTGINRIGAFVSGYDLDGRRVSALEGSLQGFVGGAQLFTSIVGGRALVRGGINLAAESRAAQFTFRGDARAPATIFEEGFTARGSSTDLLSHALDNARPPSAFVSTSSSAEVAGSFADNVYVIRPRGGIDVNQVLGPRSPFPSELEVAVPFRIAPTDVRAVTQPQQGVSILNPNWHP